MSIDLIWSKESLGTIPKTSPAGIQEACSPMDNLPAPLSLQDLEREIEETQKDFDAFWNSRRILRDRVQDQVDHPVGPRYLPTIVEWSGTSGALGVLDLAVHALERTLVELQEMKKNVKPAPPRLQIVRSEDELSGN